jgi:hypothetical protein
MIINGVWYNPKRVTSITDVVLDDVSKKDAFDVVLKPLIKLSFRIMFDYFDNHGNRESILIEEIFEEPLAIDDLMKIKNLRSHYIHSIKD